MPYIKKLQRKVYNTQIRNLAKRLLNYSQGPGDVNYVISKLISELLNGMGTTYNTINGMIGVLECVKLEMYRMVAAKYEDLKIQENGDLS